MKNTIFNFFRSENEREERSTYDRDDPEAKTRVTDSLDIRPASTTDDALVWIYPPGPDMGRKYELHGKTAGIGRDPSNSIVIESDSVSRRHARLTTGEGARIVTDLKSTNGTFVNNHSIMSQVLENGDQVKVGDTIFKYLVGSDVETGYHEEIYRMTIIDGLTGVYNKRYFLEALDRELSRSRSYGRNVSILMIDIDSFSRLNDSFGHAAVDFILQAMSNCIVEHLNSNDIVARDRGKSFAVLLPEKSDESASALAEEIQKNIARHEFVFEEEKIPVTVSIGVATNRGGDYTATDIINEAAERLYQAQSTGGNCVRAPDYSEITQVGLAGVTKIQDAKFMIFRFLGRESYGPLLAFEIKNERKIINEMGLDYLKSIRLKLRQSIETVIQNEYWIGEWESGRFLFAGILNTIDSSPEELVACITAEWNSRIEDDSASGQSEREINFAIMFPFEADQLGGKVLDELVNRLSQKLTHVDGSNLLCPFPLAVSNHLIESNTSYFLKSKAGKDSVERIIKFIAAIECGLIFEYSTSISSLSQVFGKTNRELSFGSWFNLSLDLLKLIPENAPQDLVRIIDSVLKGENRKTISRVIKMRNYDAHSVSRDDRLYKEDSVYITEVVSALLETMGNLAGYRLISVLDIISHDIDEDSYTYRILDHSGSNEFFVNTELRSEKPLRQQWCYLEKNSQSPICLAPIMFSGLSSKSFRTELFVVRKISFANKRAVVAGMGLVTNNITEMSVPRSKQFVKLEELIAEQQPV